MTGPHRRMRPLLGTFVEIGVHASAHNSADEAVSAAFSAIERVQTLMSFHAPDSELSRLNASGGHFVELSVDTLRVLRLARATMIASAGLFNVTVGGRLVSMGALPDHGQGAFLERGNASDLVIEQRRARLLRPVRLTLDGIAKGYAVDQAMRVLQAHGATGAWINAGGDLLAFGCASLEIQRRELDGRLVTIGTLRNAAVATSRALTFESEEASAHAGLEAGIEAGIEAGNETSFPGVIVAPEGSDLRQSGIWTVLARRSWRADALTKVAALADPAQRHALVRRLGGVIIADSGERQLS